MLRYNRCPKAIQYVATDMSAAYTVTGRLKTSHSRAIQNQPV
jgi:hypothetical protein